MTAITLSLDWALYSFTRSITFWWEAWSPWDILSLATFIPASASFHIISFVLVDGPMVQTILVLRLTLGLDHTLGDPSPCCWMFLSCWNFSSSYQPIATITWWDLNFCLNMQSTYHRTWRVLVDDWSDNIHKFNNLAEKLDKNRIYVLKSGRLDGCWK